MCTPGLEFRNEKGKTSLALNITMFFQASMQGTKASLNLSLCTWVAIFLRGHILESLTTQKDWESIARDRFLETRLLY